MHRYKCRILEIHDEFLKVEIDLGFDIKRVEQVTLQGVRFIDVKASEFTKYFFKDEDEIIVETRKKSADSYYEGRFFSSGVCLNDELIRQELAEFRP